MKNENSKKGELGFEFQTSAIYYSSREMISIEVAIRKLKGLGFKCQQCGNCCLKLGSELELSYEETRKWEEYDDLVLSNFGYHFLSDFMDWIPEFKCSDLWFHPKTGEELSRCPFLRKSGTRYQCLIYKLRPDACKFFPIDRSTGEVTKYATDICLEVRRLKSIIECPTSIKDTTL